MVSNTGMTLAFNTAILQTSALTFSYPDRTLFSDFTAGFLPGITLIRGGDGSGKTTLLRLLAGALPNHSGQLLINGIDLQLQRQAYKASVYWVDPREDAFDQLTVPAFFQLQRSTYPSFNDAALADMTSGLGLHEHLHKQLFMLSTGSKRKVFLAAAFAASTPVTLLDEPFSALDAASTGFLITQLKSEQNSRNRAWALADYSAPEGVHLAQVIDLGD